MFEHVGTSLFLQVSRTCIKAMVSLTFHQIRKLTMTLTTLECLKIDFSTFYAPNFEKVGDILVSACPCVCGGGGIEIWS